VEREVGLRRWCERMRGEREEIEGREREGGEKRRSPLSLLSLFILSLSLCRRETQEN
jgi:hypothetical protein